MIKLSPLWTPKIVLEIKMVLKASALQQCHLLLLKNKNISLSASWCSIPNQETWKIAIGNLVLPDVICCEQEVKISVPSPNCCPVQFLQQGPHLHPSPAEWTGTKKKKRKTQ